MHTTKKTSPYISFSSTHFATLANSSWASAMEYQQSFNKKGSKVVEPAKPDTVEETTETPVMTVEEMKIKLKEAGVSHHHALGEKKLAKLMEENNLI